MTVREDTWDRKRALAVPATWWDPIDHYLDQLRAAGCAQRTIRLRRWQLRHLAEAHPGLGPWELHTDELTSFMARALWSPETRKSMRSAVRAFYNWAATTGRITADPAASLPRVRVPRALPRPAQDATYSRALESADDRVRLMLLLAALAGLRVAEIARLAWGDIDRDQLVVHGKGGHIRIVPAHPVLLAELAAELELRRVGECGTGYRWRAGLDVWLFPGQGGQPVTAGAVTKLLSHALGGSCTPHQLRHRFATRAYAGTRDLRAVQELLGHSQPETTARYTQLPGDALTAAVAAV